MKTSDKYSTVMAAIGKVQSAVPFVEKTATADMGQRKEKYVPFEDVAAAIKTPCQDAGLVWTQGPREGNGGVAWLVTRIDHPASGEFVESELPLVTAKAGFREMGAVVSYMRRIGLIAAFGIVARGEDAENDKDAMRMAEPPKPRVARNARPVNAPEDIEKRIEDALRALPLCATMAAIDELGKTLRDEDGRALIPRHAAQRVQDAFAHARARVSSAMGDRSS